MKKVSFFILCLLCSFLTLISQEIARFNIYFDNSKDSLNANSLLQLQKEMGKLVNIPEAYLISITGHTDSIGSFDYNMELSERRAKAVREYFVQKQFPKKQITIGSFGYTRAVAPSFTEKGRELDRRVEVSIRIRNVDVAKSLGIKKEHQTYKFHSKKGKNILYEETGTVIMVPPDAFRYPDGRPYIGEVKLSYNEYRSEDEYLLANVHMQVYDHGQINPMVSAGMFDIRATDKDGNSLQINPGSKIDVGFQPNNQLSNMFLWYMDTVSKSWQPVKQLTGANLQLNNQAPIWNPQTRFWRLGIAVEEDENVAGSRIGFDSSYFQKTDALEYLLKYLPFWRERGIVFFEEIEKSNKAMRNDISEKLKSINNLKRRREVQIIPSSDSFKFTLIFPYNKRLTSQTKDLFFSPLDTVEKRKITKEKFKVWTEFEMEFVDNHLLLHFTKAEDSLVLYVKYDFRGKNLTKRRMEKASDLIYNLKNRNSRNEKFIQKKYNEIFELRKRFITPGSLEWQNYVLEEFWEVYSLWDKGNINQNVTVRDWFIQYLTNPERFNLSDSAILDPAIREAQSAEIDYISTLLNNSISQSEYQNNRNYLRAKAYKQIMFKCEFPGISKSLALKIPDSTSMSYLKKFSKRSQFIKEVIIINPELLDNYFNNQSGLDSIYTRCQRIQYLRYSAPCIPSSADPAFVLNHLDSLYLDCQIEQRRRDSIIFSASNESREFFSVQKLGIYNCDQIARLHNPKALTASYKDEKKDNLHILMIQLIDRSIPGVLQYDGHYGKGPYNFSYSPLANNQLLAYDEDGKAWYCENEEFKMIKGSNHTFKMKAVPKMKIRDKLQEFLNKTR